MVGAGHDDHGRVRGHGSEDLPRDVRWCAVRDGRGPGGRPPRPRHRLKLRHVLLPHAGTMDLKKENLQG